MGTSAPDIVIDGDFTRPQEIARRLILPFRDRGDAVSQAYEVDYCMLGDHFASAGVGKLDTTLPGAPGFILVDPGTPREVGMGLVEFTRLFAKVPEERSERSSFVFTPPPQRVQTMRKNSIEVTGRLTAVGAHHETLADAGLSLPLAARITGRRHEYKTVQSTVGGVTTTTLIPFTTWSWSRWYNYVLNTYFDATAWEDNWGLSYTIDSRLRYQYFHTTTPEDDIPILEAQLAVDLVGNYLVEGERVIEATQYSRWKGNIWEAVTRYGNPTA